MESKGSYQNIGEPRILFLNAFIKMQILLVVCFIMSESQGIRKLESQYILKREYTLCIDDTFYPRISNRQDQKKIKWHTKSISIRGIILFI